MRGLNYIERIRRNMSILQVISPIPRSQSTLYYLEKKVKDLELENSNLKEEIEKLKEKNEKFVNR